jgi:hypothetical protein
MLRETLLMKKQSSTANEVMQTTTIICGRAKDCGGGSPG